MTSISELNERIESLLNEQKEGNDSVLVRKQIKILKEWRDDLIRRDKIIDEMISTMDSFYDNGYYVGNIDFIKELPKKGEMIEARIHALTLLKQKLSEKT